MKRILLLLTALVSFGKLYSQNVNYTVEIVEYYAADLHAHQMDLVLMKKLHGNVGCRMMEVLQMLVVSVKLEQQCPMIIHRSFQRRYY